MKKHLGLVLFIFSLSLTSISQAAESLLPSGYCLTRVDYARYTLCYEHEHRQALWTKHTLTVEMIEGKQKRTNNYRADMEMEDPVHPSDYSKSGFDRGHLVPAGDMKLNYQMMSESFYMTNMSPQLSSFNRGIWNTIEDHVRDLVQEYGTAHVITAPVLEDGLLKTKKGISIPKWFYKIAYFPDIKKAKAFLIQNQKHKTHDVSLFQVTVDEIESFTGLDFFADLPDSVEDKMEAFVFVE